MNLLTDTGQNTSYTATLVKIMITVLMRRRLPIMANGTITDTVTGLMWQQADGAK
jgi:hypothetical protein